MKKLSTLIQASVRDVEQKFKWLATQATEADSKVDNEVQMMKNILSKVAVDVETDLENLQPLQTKSKKPLDVKDLNNLLSKYCNKCKSVKPPFAHHCSMCRRCVARMDHHCPWVNNCVGHNNIKFFAQFCFYTCIGAFQAAAHTIYMLIFCADKDCKVVESTLVAVFSLIGMFLAVLFCMFTAVMFCTIYTNVWTQESTIYQMQSN